VLIQKAHDALPLDNSSRAVARALAPLGYLIQSNAMLNSRTVYCDYEFRHRADVFGQLVLAEFRHSLRHIFV
jgi:hypothetical protein